MHQHEKLLDFMYPVRAEIGKVTPLITHSKFMAWDFAIGTWTGNLYQKTKHEDCGKDTTYTVLIY
jgi:hypothetical protein